MADDVPRAAPRKRGARSRSPPFELQPTGLANLGNTCYLNAVVQALAGCEPFATPLHNLVDGGKVAASADAEARLAKAFVSCLGSLTTNQGSGAVRPAALLSAIQARTPGFGGYRQQDAHELLRSLLDGLHQHLQRLQRRLSGGGAVSDGEQRSERLVADVPHPAG